MTNNEPDYDNLFFEGKKMHTPQVGDVWEFKTKRRYSIIQLVDNDNGCECIVKKRT